MNSVQIIFKMEDNSQTDICRVCRSEGLPDRPLFHPCICTGTIKWIHQECLMQWMRYSKKEYCELCSHRFSFTPIYSPDMPRRLPVKDVVGGLLSNILNGFKYWIHYTLVAIAWLGIVPVTAYRIYKCLFSGSIKSIITLPLDILTIENLLNDILHGSIVISWTLVAFMGMLWIREQIAHGGGPEWLERDHVARPQEHPPQENNENPGNQENIVQDQNLNENSNNLNNNLDLHLNGDDNNNNNPNNNYNNNNNSNMNNNNNINNNNNNPQAELVEPIQEDGNSLQGNEANNRNELLAINAPVGPQPVEHGEPEAVDNAQEEGNWNPIEWDRAAEELTWERLLGLDGSLVFLQHVFWVISLNTLFILIFAFCPYHFGNFFVTVLGFKDKIAETHFEGFITTLCGYCIIGLCLLVLHFLASVFNFQKSGRILGLCYIIVKVSLLIVLEIGLLPVICGWWLDICSLSMFDASLKDREKSFKLAPGTSLFTHWVIGIIYVYFLASFIFLLREIVRPGVLWFLINFKDPDFIPIQEWIHLSIMHHIQRLLVSSVIFGTVVLLMLWLPIEILRYLWPGFLPYTVVLQNEAIVNELSLELLLLQIILPALLEQSQSRIWLKNFIYWWCKIVSWVFGIHSYLLGDEVEQNNRNENLQNQEDLNGLGGNQVLLPRDGPIGKQPYHRPSWFYTRIFGLLVTLFTSIVLASLITLTVPVWVGRKIMAIWFVGVPLPSPPVAVPQGSSKEISIVVHELYTSACGTYLCWMIARGISFVNSYLRQGRRAILNKLKQWCYWGMKSLIASIVLFGIIPFLFGLLLELVIIMPLRVPLEQTPILFAWQDWALGVLYTKIACAIILMGPNWSMQRAIERIYRDGIRNMDLTYILYDIAAPVIASFGLALAVPYAAAHSVVPLLVTNPQLKNFIARRLYPCLLIAFLVVVLVLFQIRQFKKLYEHIKNDKYLVGKRLVNYDHQKSPD